MKKIALSIAYVTFFSTSMYGSRVEVPYGLRPIFDFFIEHKTLPLAHPSNSNIMIATGKLPHVVKTPSIFGLTIETVEPVQCILMVEARITNQPAAAPRAVVISTLPSTLVEAEFYKYTQNNELSSLLHNHLAQR